MGGNIRRPYRLPRMHLRSHMLLILRAPRALRLLHLLWRFPRLFLVVATPRTLPPILTLLVQSPKMLHIFLQMRRLALNLTRLVKDMTMRLRCELTLHFVEQEEARQIGHTEPSCE